MSFETYTLTFNGYYAEGYQVDKAAGIYCIYVDEIIEPYARELLYIEKAEDMHSRINAHLNTRELMRWADVVGDYKRLLFSTAECDIDDLERIEAAMIYEHKPPRNEEHMTSFGYDTTRIVLLRRTDFLHSDFTIPGHSSRPWPGPPRPRPPRKKPLRRRPPRSR